MRTDLISIAYFYVTLRLVLSMIAGYATVWTVNKGYSIEMTIPRQILLFLASTVGTFFTLPVLIFYK